MQIPTLIAGHFFSFSGFPSWTIGSHWLSLVQELPRHIFADVLSVDLLRRVGTALPSTPTPFERDQTRWMDGGLPGPLPTPKFYGSR